MIVHFCSSRTVPQPTQRKSTKSGYERIFQTSSPKRNGLLPAQISLVRRCSMIVHFCSSRTVPQPTQRKSTKSGYERIFQTSSPKRNGLLPAQISIRWTTRCGRYWRQMRALLPTRVSSLSKRLYRENGQKSRRKRCVPLSSPSRSGWELSSKRKGAISNNWIYYESIFS